MILFILISKLSISQIIPIISYNETNITISVDCDHTFTYILYLNEINDSNKVYDIKKFDGTNLINITTFNIDNQFNLNVIKYYQGEILIGGQFKDLFGIPNTDGIIAYDTIWHSFHNGLKGNLSDNLIATVYDIKMYNGDLIVAGGPLNIDTNKPYNPIVYLNNNEWQNYNDYLYNNDCFISTRVNKLYVDIDNNLFVAGNFNCSNLKNIAKLNSTWDPIGSNLEYDFYSNSLVNYNNSLYATSFINKISKFDNDWNDYLFDQNINDMFVYNNNLFIAGNSTLVKFDGSDFSDFNINTSEINKIFQLQGKLYIAGYIDIQNQIYKIARIDNVSNIESYNDNVKDVYPNPTSDFINVDSDGYFELFNSIGEKIYSEKNPKIISVNNYESGVYIYKIIKDGRVIKNGKIIINK